MKKNRLRALSDSSYDGLLVESFRANPQMAAELLNGILDGSLNLTTLAAILKAMGFQLAVRPIAKNRSKAA